MKKLLASLLFLASAAYCDTKTSAFPATTTLQQTDVIPVLTTPGTVPTNKIITLQNLAGSIISTITANSLGVLTTSSATATYLQQPNAAVTYAPISGSGNYIQNSSALQSGTTFYVSSGTVRGPINLSTQLIFGTGSGAGHNIYSTIYRDVGLDSATNGWDNGGGGYFWNNGSPTVMSLNSAGTLNVVYGVTAGTATVGSMTISNAGTGGTTQLTEGDGSNAFPSASGVDNYWASSSSHAIVATYNGSASTYTLTASSITPTAGQFAYWTPSGPNAWTLGSAAVSGGSGSPGGSVNQLQFNSASSFGGVAGSIVTSSSITYSGTIQVSTIGVNNGTTVPDANIKVGGNNKRGSTPAIDIALNYGIPGGHAFQDSSFVDGDATTGFNSFAAFPQYRTGPFDHYVGFQSALSYASTSTANYLYDFLSQESFDNTGGVGVHVGFVAANPTINSSGKPTTNIGFYVPAELTAGSSSNWGTYFLGHKNYSQGMMLGTEDTYFSNDTSPELMISQDKSDANIRFLEKNINIWDIGASSGTADFMIKDLNAVNYVIVQGNSGNVGISTGTPTYKLDVNGGAIIRSTITVTSGVAFTQTYKAAICQSGTASLGFSAFSTSAPVVSCSISTSTVLGLASFVDNSTMSVQDHFLLPTDWTGAVNANIVWNSTMTTNSVVWQIRTGCAADGELPPPSWNAFATVTDATKGTASLMNTATISAIPTTNCSAGEEMYFEFLRDPANAADTLASTANLITLQLTFRRTLAL